MATGEESREKRKLEREGRGRKGKRKRGREGEGEQSTHLSRVRSWCKEYRYAFIAVQAGAGVLLCLCLQVHKIPVGKGRCLVELWHFLRFTFSPVFFLYSKDCGLRWRLPCNAQQIDGKVQFLERERESHLSDTTRQDLPENNPVWSPRDG